MTEKLLNILKEEYELTELSAGDMATLKVNGMTFAIKAYQAKVSYYVNGLLEKGGPPTDVFKKALGSEITAELFENILFGIK